MANVWGDDPFVVVNVGPDRKRLSRVVEIVQELGVVIGRAEYRPRPDGAEAFAFQVPRDRIVEVIVALECRGFSDARAYDTLSIGHLDT